MPKFLTRWPPVIDANLPKVAVPAWQAYQAMEQTKQRHLNYLKELNARHERGGSRSIAESVYLESLLKEHDQMVTAFRGAMRALLVTDLEAHNRLLQYITKFNENLGTGERPH